MTTMQNFTKIVPGEPLGWGYNARRGFLFLSIINLYVMTCYVLFACNVMFNVVCFTVVMSLAPRPASASRIGHGLQSKNGCDRDLLSYEDIIIAKYLEELRKPQSHSTNRYNVIIIIAECSY